MNLNSTNALPQSRKTHGASSSRIKRTRISALTFLMIAATGLAMAQDDLHVRKSAAAKTSLDLSGFSSAGGAAALFRQTLEADLDRSGWFLLTRPATFTVAGSCSLGGDAIAVQCQVLNTVKSAVCLNKSYSQKAAEARRLAHQVADEIIMATKGFRGIASGRILLVGNRNGSKELYMCDADGGNLRQLTADNSISVAPYISADGSRVVYTSFRKGFPDIYLIDLKTGNRSCIANYPGTNLAGGISPNGREVLMVLSKDGNPDIYIKQLDSGKLTRLTQTPRAGEASPVWSPDGSQIAYVSDMQGAGRPQLYVMARTGNSRLLTSRGRENVSPDWGPNGWIAFCSRREGAYGIYIINPATGEERGVSPADANYEDPSWAPDGRHIVCTRGDSRRSSVYMLDTMGDPPLCLTRDGGNWSSPSWCSQ